MVWVWGLKFYPTNQNYGHTAGEKHLLKAVDAIQDIAF